MVQLQENLDAIAATKTLVVGVSYDSVKILKKFSDSSKLKFPLLADPGSKVIRAFGIYNKKGLPHPGTYVIGKDREVLAKLFVDGFRQRHTPAELAETLKKIKQ